MYSRVRSACLYICLVSLRAWLYFEVLIMIWNGSAPIVSVFFVLTNTIFCNFVPAEMY